MKAIGLVKKFTFFLIGAGVVIAFFLQEQPVFHKLVDIK